MGRKVKDLAGQKFNRLLVIERLNELSGKNSHWRCLCECGNEVHATPFSLRANKFGCKSCAGKLRNGGPPSTHGQGGSYWKKNRTPTYACWASMIARCKNPKNPRYPRYGGRGIKVCDRWKSFENFFADMGEKPSDKCIDRINNDWNYEPSNCRWATPKESGNNTSHCVFLEFLGQRKTMSQWSEYLGICYDTLQRRLKRGWPIEKALNKLP